MAELIPIPDSQRVDIKRLEQARQRQPQPDYPDINPMVVWLAALLDDAFVIPGTTVRIGLDPLIGLIPVVGDALGALFGYVILQEAKRLKVSRWTRARMVWNYVVDTVVGAIPLVGDMFDIAFKANRKNLDLMQAYLDKQRRRATTESL